MDLMLCQECEILTHIDIYLQSSWNEDVFLLSVELQLILTDNETSISKHMLMRWTAIA